MIEPATCRAARALLNWSQQQLADAARVGISTVKKFEAGMTTPMTNNLIAIRSALEQAGVEFVSEDDGGPGVLKRRLHIRAYIRGEGLHIEARYVDLELEGPDNDFDLSFLANDSALEALAGRMIVDEADAKAVARKGTAKLIAAMKRKLATNGLLSSGGRPREILAADLS